MKSSSFKNLKLIFIVSLILLPWPVIVCATTINGKVVRVLDGDTIEVLHNQHPERIRLNGIDCPEKGQAFGKRAKQFTSGLLYGKEVTVHVFSKDRHGRSVGDVILPDGTNVSLELLKEGLAWWYRQYSKDKTLGILEGQARQAKRGLWADPNPIPPWERRHPKKDRTPLPLGNRSSELMGTPDMTPTPVIANRNSQVYHRADCPNYTATAPKNRVTFNNEADAEAAGYHRARNCP